MTNNCPFCDTSKIWEEGTLYRDDEIIAMHRKSLTIPGYTVIYPSRHVTNFSELSASELTKLGAISKTVTRVLKEMDIPRSYLCSFGEMVNHFHLHIFPRHKEMADIEEIYTNGKLDGAKLFSYAQQNMRIADPSAAPSAEVTAAITVLKKALN